MSTTKAPTLFGKRMRKRSRLSLRWYAQDIAGLAPYVEPDVFDRSGWRPGYGDWRGRKHIDAQAAANDAERYLRRLHKALGKVVGREGK